MIDLHPLLQSLFPQGLPSRLEALLPRSIPAARLEDYALNPVLSTRPAAPPRLAIARASAPQSWEKALQLLWPDSGAQDFFSQAPAKARRMLDSDGGEEVVFYLDDLQDHEEDLQHKLGGTLVCMCLHHPSGRQSHITRHLTPPMGILPEALEAVLKSWVSQGAEGVWGIHWREGLPSGVLWITESRWRGRLAWNRAILRGWGLPKGWELLERAALKQGLQIYPDAVELLPDGQRDITVGFLRHG